MNNPYQSLSTQQKNLPRVIAAAKLSNFLRLNEKDFSEVIQHIENSGLFKALRSMKVITYKPFLRSKFSNRFLELKPEILPESPTTSFVESVSESYPKAMLLARKIGLENFLKYFLHEEESDPEMIAQHCKLSLEEVAQIRSLVDTVGIHSDFFFPSHFKNQVSQAVSFLKIAHLEWYRDEITIAYFSPNYARGKYQLNQELLHNWKTRQRQFSLREIHKLLTKLETINARKSILHRILIYLIEIQKKFIKTEKDLDMKPVNQKQAAEILQVHPSLVCRSIFSKSIEVPWGEEIPIQQLFLSDKKYRHHLIFSLVNTNQNKVSPFSVQNILEQKFHIRTSIRTIYGDLEELKKQWTATF